MDSSSDRPPRPPPPPPPPDDTSNTVVRRHQIRPLDVLMGRGHYHRAGNSRFLRIVAARRDEYVASKGNGTKTRIAEEVMELVYDPSYRSGREDGFELSDCSGVDGGGTLRPGRFLQLENHKSPGGEPIYRIISGRTVVDKIKMNLRQKPRGGSNAASRGGLGPAMTAMSSVTVGSNGKGSVKRRAAATSSKAESESSAQIQLAGEGSAGPPTQQGEGLVDGRYREADLWNDQAFLEEEDLGGDADCSAAVGNGAGSASVSPPHIGALTPPIESDEARQQLLTNVTVAHLQASALAAQHRREAAYQSTQSAVSQGLEALGRALVVFFTGIDPSSSPLLPQSGSAASSPGIVAAGAASWPDESGIGGGHSSTSQQPRRRKRTGMIGGGGGSGGGHSRADGTPSPSLSTSASPGLADALREAGLPASLGTVLTSLLDAPDPTAPDRYRSAAEVEADLGRMVAEPDRYLFDQSHVGVEVGTLHFTPNRLYGRTKQQEQVASAFDKIIVSQEETHGYLLISGPPGSGKTALVEALRQPLAQRRGRFVWVKFDSQQQENPMANICRGLDEYFQRLLGGDDPTLLSDIGDAVRGALGPRMAVMKDLIPALAIVTGGGGWPESHQETEGRETYHLILHCLKQLVNAIAHPSHPIIVLFDDLQWSDAASQDIIRMLVTDEASEAAMFIGCYRDNEVDENHPVAENVGAILMSLVPLATVRLGNLDKEDVNDLCSDVLHLSPRLTQPLAEALHSKTGGNPMFVRQLMRSLYEDSLLQYAASERRWRWDINAIRAKDVADNAVDLLISMMRSYGPEVRQLLQVASCLGFRFDVTAITLLVSAFLDASASEISTHIEAVMADGLLLMDGPNAYRFSHDQIWLAAYSLTPLTERSAQHLLVGRRLLEQTISGGDADEFLFTVADQLNRGIGAVSSHSEELEIAELNLRAGEKALSAFLFQPASTYLLQGSALLNENDWNAEYTLCIQLYSACAEVQLARGR